MGLSSFNSAYGPISVESLSGELIAIRFKAIGKEEEFPDSLTMETIRQLKAYFSGKLKKFSIPYRLVVTDYQERVLNSVSEIPYGKIISYSALAAKIEDPSHSRAVAAVNAKNPIPIIIPCHRVIGLNGSLVGYLGGITMKKKLIELESSSKQLQLF